jgi:hypothetical protein
LSTFNVSILSLSSIHNSLSSATSNNITSLVSSITQLENSCKNEIIVPLNQTTLNGQSPPIAPTSPYDSYSIGWYWDNTVNDTYMNTTNKVINWTVFPKNDNSTNIQINPYTNRIYFNCILYTLPGGAISTVPTLTVSLTGNWSGNITFKYTGTTITTAGAHCFVIDLGSTNTTFGQIYNGNSNILPLTFDNSSPPGQLLSAVNIAGNTITNISVNTSTSFNYKFGLTGLFLEENNSTNSFGGITDTLTSYKSTGVTEFVFLSSVVKFNYDEHTLSYIFNLFLQKKPAKLVSPVNYTVAAAAT